MKCPICKKEVEPGGAHAPFCSERCRTIDLANWATGKYRIPTRASAEAQTEEQTDEDEPRNGGAGGHGN
jgi:endogenous inhibitor of DNA gyrase (YacG/DUF329 family)